jgi:RHS repeat-associated protein
MNINGCSPFSCLVRVLFALLLLGVGVQSAYAERKTTYYHTDGLGSAVAASNDAGNLLWRKQYAPFGEQLNSTGEQEKLAYTGKEHDDVTGLTYFGARYYDPHLGRFMSVDPVAFVESEPMTFNRYSYANNNPYKYVDPDGEFVNFAAKFVLDVGINVAFNYVTTGELNVGGALKESAVGILNPAKTVAKAGKLLHAMAKVEKKLPPPCKLKCFAAGTTVLTDHGFVAIETLQVGDLVWAYNPDTDESALKPILKTFVNTADTIWHLTLDKNGETYRHEVTGSHPYYVPGIGWVEVANLHIGNALLTEGGETAVVTGVFDTRQVQPTYNFEVADINTYYVSAAKVLVHNCGGIATTNKNAARLNSQLAAQEIAGGHAFEKHVLHKGEFAGLGIRTRKQFAEHIENVINNPTSVRTRSDGATAYWHKDSGTLVIRNPRSADGGTAFQPREGQEFIDNQLNFK